MHTVAYHGGLSREHSRDDVERLYWARRLQFQRRQQTLGRHLVVVERLKNFT